MNGDGVASPGPRYCLQCGGALEWRPVGGLDRWACVAGACGWVLWDNPVPVVAAVVEYQGRVLLARNVAWPEGMFALVTGYLERGETPEQGVAREVKEETDLNPGTPELLGVYPFERKNQIIIAYRVPATGDIRLNEELAEYRLIEPDKLRTWDSGTGLALEEWLRRYRLQDAPSG